jgi:hypothetical protein
MILGSYSIPHIIEMYKDVNQQHKLNEYIWLLIFSVIIWITAFIMLIYYWNTLELWAQVLGVVGLFFNSFGPLFTIFVVYFGIKQDKKIELDMSINPLYSAPVFNPPPISSASSSAPIFNANKIPL